LVRVELVGPPEEVPLRLLLRAAEDSAAPGAPTRGHVVPPLERREALLDRGALCIPLAHAALLSRWRGAAGGRSPRRPHSQPPLRSRARARRRRSSSSRAAAGATASA